jgi:hypothetical protein
VLFGALAASSCNTTDPCTGRIGCAAAKAKELHDAARAEKAGNVSRLAWPLVVALDRADCAAAGEYARALDTIQVAGPLSGLRSKAVRGVFAGCGSAAVQAAAPDAGDAQLRFTRGACHGTCPIFVMTLRSNGEATFTGHVPGRATVTRSHRIPHERAREIFALLDRVGFARFAPMYTIDVSDVAPATITLERDGNTHRVDESAGCLSPAAFAIGLCYLESKLDEFVEEQGFLDAVRTAPEEG